MLSYNHGYHAGNHADVIKHLCWIAVIRYLRQKDKSFTLYDTHSGAGRYQLDDAQASKTQEYLTGIARLANLKPTSALLTEYLALCLPHWQANAYPGSPVIAAESLREQDKLVLMEMHPGEAERLQTTMRASQSSGQVSVHHRDGFEGVIGMVPPSPNRGAILIDPPYERKEEYRDVPQAIDKILSRWQNAQILVWYPLLSARAGDKAGASEMMLEKITEKVSSVFCAEMRVEVAKEDTGMYGSGVCIINPSWNLDVDIEGALQEVRPDIGEQVEVSVRWLKQD